jgi:hypothetical protein
MVRVYQLLKGIDENRPGHLKLFQTFLDRTRQNALTFSRQTHQNVDTGTGALHETVRLGSVFRSFPGGGRFPHHIFTLSWHDM